MPIAKLFSAFMKAPLRKRWLTVAMKVRTANPNRTIRASFDDGTLVQFYFTDKGTRSSVALQHQKLADKDTADQKKQWWTERLDALAKMLG